MANVIKHKRGSGSDPVASDLVVGEVAIRTDVGKLFTKMDNGSVAEIAGGGSDIAINTLSSSSGTGGGSATFNGSAYRFTLSQPPSVSAQQLLVSINGVIQKPVAGTGQPSEGFSVDGTDIILGDAPATGSDFFILTFKSLGVSEPADNSVTSAKIVDGAIVNADINASAAIAGTKISPDFGSQNIVTTGNASVGETLTVTGNNPNIVFTDSNSNPDFKIYGSNGAFSILDSTNAVNRFVISSSGGVTIGGNTNFDAGIDVTGAITGTGDLTIDTSTLHVDSTNNRVGIGTTNPLHKLEVENGTDQENIIVARGADATTEYAGMGVHGGNAIFTGGGVGSTSAGMAFRTAASGNEQERMRIDSSGRVGIAQTPLSEKLEVSGAIRSTSASANFSAGAEAVFMDFISGNRGRIGTITGTGSARDLAFNIGNLEKMRINTSGNVGIGTTNPGALLTLNNTIPELRVQSSNNNFGMGDALGLISLYTADGSTPGAGEVFRIKTESASSIGADYTTRLYNRNGAGGGGTEISLGNGQGSVYFSTNTTGNATASVRMVVMSDGNVGIGTTSPTGKFAVSDGTVVAEINPFSASNGVFIGTRSNHAVLFKTNAQERMRIDTSGRVLIGSTTEGNESADELTIGSSGNTGITLRSGTSANTSLFFSDATSGAAEYAGSIQYRHASDIMTFGTASTERIRIHSGGEVSIATTSINLQGGGASDFYLNIQANVGSNHNGIIVGGVASGHGAFTTRPSGSHNYFAGFFLNSSASGVGNIEVGSSGTSFNTSSDYRLKENVVNISDGITRVKQLLPRRFNWIIDETNTLQDGFLAHEVSSIVPEAVTGEKDAVATKDGGQYAKGDPIYQTIDHSKLVPLLVAALQEAIGRIEALEAK
jgi:hypothetical protein